MERTVSIQLELHLDEDSLTGRASDGAAEKRFSGWLGLVAAIDELVQRTTLQDERSADEPASRSHDD